MTETILTAIFLVFIVIREWMHSQEVKLLSEAVIAKNIYEYKDAQNKPQVDQGNPIPKVVPLDSVSDEAFLHSIKKELGRLTPVDKFKEKIKKVWPTKLPSTPQG